MAADLAANPVQPDELAKVTEPLRQLILRASTGNQFWMYQLAGATHDPQRVELLRSLMSDYTEATPEEVQALAAKYFRNQPGWRLAVIPAGQSLAQENAARVEAVTGR